MAFAHKAILPWRQVHLDFHTPAAAGTIAAGFDADAFAQTIVDADVQSVVLFGKCHHGWSYYDSKVGQRHPGLDFDLLDAQVAALKRRSVETVLYLSVGWDERNAHAHLDWRQVGADGQFFCLLGNHIEASWKYMCLGTPYLDHVVAQVSELLDRYPDADGLWLDIIKQEPCACVHCQEAMTAAGLDWMDPAHRLRQRQTVLDRYFTAIDAAVGDRAISLFHNTSMVPRGDRRFFSYQSHVEIEALPTGGWGYDHLPISARYGETLGLDRIGVTARFHLIWGELGSYKHPDALRYETGAMLANGTKLCIGDQLDANGVLDASAWKLMGTIFAEAKAKQPWCEGSIGMADIGILSSVGVRQPGAISREARHCPEDEGAARILAEGHFLFDVIDTEADFGRYRLLVLPDKVRLGPELAARLQAYADRGGCILLTGESGLAPSGVQPMLDTGADCLGPAVSDPRYVLLREDLRPDWATDRPFVIMAPSLAITARADGQSLGDSFDALFNRRPQHFYGHVHAPPQAAPSGLAAGVRKGGICWLPFPLFTLYRAMGHATIRHFVTATIRDMLGQPLIAASGLPPTATLNLRAQPAEGRHVLHLLHGERRLKGSYVLGQIEVVDALPSIGPVDLAVAMPVARARLVPQGDELAVSQADGIAHVHVPRFAGHQMIEIS
ncbi:MAG: beta-galactosidase trimerization domain-containing protein [Alphaproteobacteria bacterium]|nr:beta-galactosidase trimerization domain-containing protein [Alphaproteobacteria bacterium]